MATKDGPDTRWGKSDAHRDQLTVDPAISPGGVLPRQPEDELDGADRNARSSQAVGVGPPTPDQVPMPAEQGLGLDEETSSPTREQERTQPGKKRPVTRPQRRARHLTTQDRHLVTKHGDFDGQLAIVTPKEPHQLENPDERQV